MNLDWDNEFEITFPVANSKELPPHFAIVGKFRIHSNKEHGSNTLELARTTIWKDPMLLGPYAMINNLTPMQQQAMLNKKSVMLFVIINIKMGFLHYSRLTISLIIIRVKYDTWYEQGW